MKIGLLAIIEETWRRFSSAIINSLISGLASASARSALVNSRKDSPSADVYFFPKI